MLKKVKIGAHTFDVIYTGGLATSDNYGKSSLENLQIFIRNDVPESVQQETLLHEILHIIREENGLEREDTKQEEREVQNLAHALYQCLVENNLWK